MNKTRRAIGAAALAVLVLVGCAAYTPQAKGPHTTIVQPWNQGFADSKQDDCEQGFQPACEWLQNTH